MQILRSQAQITANGSAGKYSAWIIVKISKSMIIRGNATTGTAIY
jgi:hypothetical protein